MTDIVQHSRITSKGQTTVPKAVRQALGVREGDTLAFRIEPDGVRLVRAEAVEADDPALAPFLALLAEDIARRPEALVPLTPAFRARIARLTKGVSADLDAPIEGDVDL